MSPATRLRSLRRRGLLGPLVALGVFGAVALAAEGAARLALRLDAAPPTHFARADVWGHTRSPFHTSDAELLWRPLPGFRKGNVRINELGMRGGALPARDAADPVQRILTLGDSVTFGFAVDEEQSWSRVLEDLLAAEAGDTRSVEVLNCGVIGYSSEQVMRRFGRLARELRPDFVVAQFGYNDHHSATLSDREKLAGLSWRVVPPRWLEGSAVFRLARRSWTPAPLLRSEPVPRVGLEDFTNNVLAVRDTARSAGAGILFLTIPTRTSVPLVENFVRVELADSHGIAWARQFDIAAALISPREMRPIIEHFTLGRDLGSVLRRPGFLADVETLISTHPDLAVFHYLRARALTEAGRLGEAAAEEAAWRDRDDERSALDAYNDRLRALAGRGEIDLLDLAPVVASAERDEASEPLFLDAVHPSPRGHARLAREVAAWLTNTGAL